MKVDRQAQEKQRSKPAIEIVEENVVEPEIFLTPMKVKNDEEVEDEMIEPME